MEKTVNRDNFMSEFISIVNDINLTPKFLDELKKHPYFQKYRHLLENNNEWSDKEKVIFILTELTRERSTCNAIIYILEKSNQNGVADKLKDYNKSLDELPFDTQTDDLIVTTVSSRKDTPSMSYFLNSKVRGQCIIINNVESPQSPNIIDENGYLYFEPKGLKRDTARLKNVFEQLHFNVHTYKDWDANEIRINLTKIATDLGKDEAFALFIITHGEDEKVLGSKACECYKIPKFKKRKWNENELKQIKDDRISTKEIVDLFSEENCPQLALKPKLFFFVCCRIKVDEQVNVSNESSKRQKKTDKSCQVLGAAVKRGGIEFPKENEYIKEQPLKDPPIADETIICYTCAEGYPTYFSPEWGISYFTQAFTLIISQYACDEYLVRLLSRTFKRLIKFFEEEGEKERMKKGGFAIEVRLKAVGNSLYFNPGLIE